MYCTHCGYQNTAGSKFCESCGKSLITSQPRAQVMPSRRVTPAKTVPTSTPVDWSSWLRRLPSIGAAIVVYGFFLPWVLVSCNLSFGSSDSGIKASGYEIASGNYAALNQLQEYSALFGNYEQVDSQETNTPMLWLILVLGFVGFLALSGGRVGSVFAILAGILGISGMSIVTLRLSGLGQELSRQGLRLQLEEGFWITWIGFVWLAMSAIMTIRQKR
jgi:hypothetical protein